MQYKLFFLKRSQAGVVDREKKKKKQDFSIAPPAPQWLFLGNNNMYSEVYHITTKM